MNIRAVPVSSSTLDEEARTIEAVISTDQPVAVYDWRAGRIIDEVLVARGGKFPKQVPLFESHWASSSNQLGSVRQIAQTDNGWRATLHFAKNAGDRREEAWEMVRQGHTTDVSIGYRYATKDMVDIEPGASAIVDGIEYKANKNRMLRIVKKWRGTEVSTVPVGADDQAKMRAEHGDTEPPSEEPDNTDSTRADDGDDQPGEDEENQEREGEDMPKTAPQGETKTEPEGKREEQESVDVSKERQEAAAEERKRISAITAYRGEIDAELIDEAVEKGMNVEQARAFFFDKTFKSKKADEPEEGERRNSGVSGDHAHKGGRANKNGAQVLAAALMLRHGIEIDGDALASPVATHMMNQRGVNGGWLVSSARSLKSSGSLGQHEEVFDLAYQRQSLPMRDMVRLALEDEGVRCSSFSDEELMQRAVSSSSVANIFTLAFNARLLRGFVGVPDTTSLWTRPDQLPNFQPAERIQMGKYTKLNRRARGQTPEHGEIDSKGESLQLFEYASMFLIDEQDLVDNTFGNIRQITPEEMGEAAAELAPDLAYSVLMSNPTMAQDNTALFHADHNNLNGTRPLNYDNLASSRTDFKTRKLDNGRYISVRGEILLVPVALETTAEELVNDEKITGTTKYNANRGKHTVVADPRLDDGVTNPETGVTVAGSSGNWYLGERAGKYGISLATLEGRGRSPRSRRLQNPNHGYAIGWSVDHVVGCGATGYEGLQKNTP